MNGKLTKANSKSEANLKISFLYLSLAMLGACGTIVVFRPQLRLPLFTCVVGLWIGGCKAIVLSRMSLQEKLSTGCFESLSHPIELWKYHEKARAVLLLVAEQVIVLLITAVLLTSGASQLNLIGAILLCLMVIQAVMGNLILCWFSAVGGSSLIAIYFLQQNPTALGNLMRLVPLS